MLLEFTISGLVFIGAVIGIAWPLVSRCQLDPAEKVGATIMLSLVAIYLLGWFVYVATLPTSVLWIVPLFALTGLYRCRQSLIGVLRDPFARTLLRSQFVASLWCLGWLGLVVDYSGGKWVGDWFGHWQRALFFIHRWPRDLLFNGFDPVPSRPPLANVVNGVFLRVTQFDFAHYQFFSTLFSSLAFLPAALITRRLVGREHPNFPGKALGSMGILLLLFMVSPLFVQNSTYAWTKLPAAFFVLTALYFFLRAHDTDSPRCAAPLFGTSLGAAILTHYSAVPYALLLGLGWFWLRSPTRKIAGGWRSTRDAIATGTLLLGTWFGWACLVYGRGTFLSNTTVTDQAPHQIDQFRTIALNIRDSIVPHFLGGADFTFFHQQSPWGWWRDWFFQLYQCNILFAFGSVSWLVLLGVLAQAWRLETNSRRRSFWLCFGLGMVVLGIAVHGARESGGLAHICLQPFVLLGVALLAAKWKSLSLGLRRLLVAGTTLDLMTGIVLQFGVESHGLDRWLAPQLDQAAIALSYSQPAQPNFRVKFDAGWVFFGDLLASYQGWLVGVLILLFGFAIVSAGRKRPPPNTNHTEAACTEKALTPPR